MRELSMTYLKPDGGVVVNKTNAENKDIVTVLNGCLNRAANQVRDMAHHFKGSSEIATARKIFNFLKDEIKYVRDSELFQDIKLPARFVADGTGDCKSYSLFTSAILSNLGISHRVRYVSYSYLNPTPSHVYVVTDNGVVIDAVWGKFNDEKPYKHKRDMKVRTLSGINGVHPSFYNDYQDRMIGGTGINGRFGDWLKQTKVGQKAKTVTAAPVRGAFLALVRLNVLALATLLNLRYNSKVSPQRRSLAAAKYKEMETLWYNWGGNRTELSRVVAQGAKAKPFGVNLPAAKNLKFVKNLRSAGIISGMSDSHCIGSIGSAGSIAAFLATATPIVVAAGGIMITLSEVFKEVKDNVTEEEKDNIVDVSTGGGANLPYTATGGGTVLTANGGVLVANENQNTNTEKGSDTGEGNNTNLLVGATILAKLAGLF